MYAFWSLGFWLELVMPESALVVTFILASTVAYLSEQRRSQAELNRRACQQAAVAELSQQALSGLDLIKLMDAASATIAQTLSMNFVNVLESLPGQSTLRLCAGTGWKEGYVGRARIDAVPNSITSNTLASNQPVVVEDICTQDFSTPDPLLNDHNIVSSMTVIIPGQEGPPFGILGIYTNKRWRFSDNDRHFMQSVANVLAQAIARKRLEQRLLHDSLHDGLSGLPNRILFMDRLEHTIQRTQRYSDYRFAVLFLDLDRFKVINDSLGHLIGDQLLIETGARLLDCVRPEDTVARIGGDEFTILLDGIEDISETNDIAERIQHQLSAPFKLDGHEIFITVSIGIAPSTMGYESANDLLRDADTVMYHAKMLGKGRHELFNEHMRASAQARWQLENDLRQAIEKQELQLYYQPIVALGSNRLEGFEALLRWQHPCRGLISPTEFIPIAEETGLILPIGQWVLLEACKQMRAWQSEFDKSQPQTISVNLSGKQLSDPQLTTRIHKILKETELDARLLKLEITETVFMENFESTAATFSQLRALDVALSIDDFGTGYSSLSYLHHFPINILKIDRSFVSRMAECGESMAIIKTIVTLAKSLGMSVIAEGIESAQQKLLLQGLRCESGQGYFFSEPLDGNAAGALRENCAKHSLTRA
jgi:diguanylate cyclase (GGDEF)-like protein